MRTNKKRRQRQPQKVASATDGAAYCGADLKRDYEYLKWLRHLLNDDIQKARSTAEEIMSLMPKRHWRTVRDLGRQVIGSYYENLCELSPSHSEFDRIARIKTLIPACHWRKFVSLIAQFIRLRFSRLWMWEEYHECNVNLGSSLLSLKKRISKKKWRLFISVELGTDEEDIEDMMAQAIMAEVGKSLNSVRTGSVA